MLNSIAIIPSSQDEATSSGNAMNCDVTRSVNGSSTGVQQDTKLSSEGEQFLSELKRRKVYKVEVAYGVASWLLIQAGSIFLPTFNAPPCMMQAIVVFLALG